MLQSDIKNLCFYFSSKFITCENSSAVKPVSDQIDKLPFTMIKDRVCYTIQKYQEMPQLLDCLMEVMVTSIMKEIKMYLEQIMKKYIEAPSQELPKIPPQFHEIANIVFMLCKVRNYKFINKFFPHEVKDLEPVLHYLIQYRNVDTAIWETKYLLLIWLSIIVLVPFDLSTIDSRFLEMETQKFEAEIGQAPKKLESSADICTNLIEIGKFYLRSTTKMREASAVFMANLLGRPDVLKTAILSSYIHYSIQAIEKLFDDMLQASFVAGLYLSLIEIFKIVQRKDLLKQIPDLLKLIQIQGTKKENTTIRHYKVKLIQRIGMVYLKPRAVAWAYKKGNKNLLQNLQKTITDSKIKTNVEKATASKKTSSQLASQEECKSQLQGGEEDATYFEDIDIEKLEDIIDFLVENLKDKDTVVRWSSAKGLGRITGRLDSDMANDVVSALYALFAPNESEVTWHGGCLAIGELSRRGLLLPQRLGEVFQIINKALHFDVNQGNYSVGANVRDSACYIGNNAHPSSPSLLASGSCGSHRGTADSRLVL